MHTHKDREKGNRRERHWILISAFKKINKREESKKTKPPKKEEMTMLLMTMMTTMTTVHTGTERRGREERDTDLMRANRLSRNCWMWAVAGFRKIKLPSSCLLSTKPPRSATCSSPQANSCLSTEVLGYLSICLCIYILF